MIRIVLENIFFFLLPTLCYVAYIAFRRNTWPGLWAVLREAPLVRLFILGAVMMLATLALLSSRSENKPGEAYQPSVFRDGKLQPAQRIPHTSPAPAATTEPSTPSADQTAPTPPAAETVAPAPKPSATPK